MNQDVINDIRLDLIDSTNQVFKNLKKVKLNDNDEADVAKLLTQEISKLKQNLLTIGVVGVMKAGKSTFINSIIGREILPSRTLGMTFVPTKIQHVNSDTDAVEYHFQNSIHFQEFADWLSIPERLDEVKKNKISTKVDKLLIDNLERGTLKFSDRINSLEASQAELFNVNDLARINAWYVKHDDKCPIDLLRLIKNEDDIPTIYVSFDSIKINSSIESSLALIDSPGPDEAGQHEVLGSVLKQVLKNASGVYCVINGKSIDNKSDDELREHIYQYKDIISDRLEVVVNQKDQIELDDVKKIIKKSSAFREFGLSDEKIHELSSKQVLYSKLAINNALDFSTNYSSYKTDPPKWFVEFANLQGGTKKYLSGLKRRTDKDPEFDIAEEVLAEAVDLQDESGFDCFLKSSLHSLQENSAINVIKSTIDKLTLKIDEPVLHTLNGRIKAIELDNKTLKEFQEELHLAVKKIEGIQKETDIKIKEQFSENETYSGIVHSIMEGNGHSETKSAEKEYKKIEDLLSKQSQEYENEKSAEEERIKINSMLKDAMEKLKIELGYISQNTVKRRLEDINLHIESDIKGVIETTNKVNSEISDWCFEFPTLKQYSESLELEDCKVLSSSEKVTRYHERDVFGNRFFSSIATFLIGKRKEVSYEKRYKIDKDKMQKDIENYIGAMVQFDFKKGVDIVKGFQTKLTTYNKTLGNIINDTIKVKKLTQEEIEQDLLTAEELQSLYSNFKRNVLSLRGSI